MDIDDSIDYKRPLNICIKTTNYKRNKGFGPIVEGDKSRRRVRYLATILYSLMMWLTILSTGVDQHKNKTRCMSSW